MIELQKVYTTHEQSKKLMVLGVPADSADCYYYTEVDKQPKILTTDNFDWTESSYIPCWSIGRLIELSSVCGNGYPALFMKKGEIIMEWFIKFVEEEVTNKVWDFSKLED